MKNFKVIKECGLYYIYHRAINSNIFRKVGAGRVDGEKANNICNSKNIRDEATRL